VRAIADMVVRGAPPHRRHRGRTAWPWLCDRTPAIPAWRVRTRSCWPRVPQRSTCAGLSTKSARLRSACHPRSAPRPPIVAQLRSATRTWPYVRPLASMASASSKPSSSARASSPVNVLTHCNAGWLATVDWGNGPGAGVQGSRCRDPGARVGGRNPAAQPGRVADRLGMGQARCAHHVIVDNAGGHFMQHGAVDVCSWVPIEPQRTGDVCNKIGTYLKALAARDCQVAVLCLPAQSQHRLDHPRWRRRNPHRRTRRRRGNAWCATGARREAQLGAGHAADSPVANPGFDVTPARLVTGLVTERGVCAASANGLAQLFPERAGRR